MTSIAFEELFIPHLPRLPEIHRPVLLIGGEHDEAAPDTLLTFRDALRRAETTP
ncbi:MAG: hypothetical protein GX548_04375 [Lentisphaerae bacterium]|nr:hypothetical protein [Lentisphaerota bacterium]